MSAPAFPDWDTNATHTTPLTSGHKTDGYVHDEIPTSDETNEWMMLVGLWIRYIASLMTQTIELPPTEGFGSTAAAGVAAPSGPGAGTIKVHLAVGAFGSGDVASWTRGIPIPIGFKITRIRARINQQTNATGGVLNTYTSTDSGNTLVDQVQTVGTGVQTLTSSALSLNAAAVTSAYVNIASVGGIATASATDIFAIEVDIAPQ
jgi:hypothetical protein